MKPTRILNGLLVFFSTYSFAYAQVPGDDYEQTCTSPSSATVPFYGGAASCSFSLFGGGIMYVGDVFPPQRSSTVIISRIQGTCLATLRFVGYGTVTVAPVCSPPTPKQPFVTVAAQNSVCIAGAMNGSIVWSAQPGDSYELEWASASPGSAYVPYSGGSNPGVGYAIYSPIGVPNTHNFRLRTTRNGVTGSWSYTAASNTCASTTSD